MNAAVSRGRGCRGGRVETDDVETEQWMEHGVGCDSVYYVFVVAVVHGLVEA